MRNHLGLVLTAAGVAVTIIAAALSDGGTGLRSASLMGIAGLIALTAGVVYADRADDAARKAERAADGKIRKRRMEYRAGWRRMEK